MAHTQKIRDSWPASALSPRTLKAALKVPKPRTTASTTVQPGHSFVTQSHKDTSAAAFAFGAASYAYVISTLAWRARGGGAATVAVVVLRATAVLEHLKCL